MKRLLSILFLFLSPALRGEEFDSAEKIVPYIQEAWRSTRPDAPERYAIRHVTPRYGYWADWMFLRGISPTPERMEQAARVLGGVCRDLRLGRSWPHREPERFELPFLRRAPAVDGELSPGEWAAALELKSAYPLNSAAPEPDESRFFLGWDREFLYFAADIRDAELRAIPEAPWQGDCVEFFLLPSMRLKRYWELVVAPDRTLFQALYSYNPTGNPGREPGEAVRGLRCSVAAVPGGYQAELAVPFSELPGYLLGNEPKAGETIRFLAVRSDGGNFFSATPLLYNSHNIFCWPEGVLAQPEEPNEK